MTEPRERYRATYRFGAVERRGALGGLRPGQVVLLGSACVFGVAVFRRMPTAGGLVLALVAVGAACIATWLPVGGRTIEEWAPVVTGWLTMGQRRYSSPAPLSGTQLDLTTRRSHRARVLPAPLDRIELLGVPLGEGRDLGVLADRRAGTFTAVAVLRVRSFGLLGASEQERRLGRWGRVLASLARDGGAVRRVQVMERTLPHDEDQLARWLRESGDASIAPGNPLRSSYEGLLTSAADVTQDHEVLIGVQVDPTRLRRPSLTRDREEAGAQLAVREIRSLAERLEACDAGVTGLLSADQVAWTVRLAYEPHLRTHYSRLLSQEAQQLGPTGAEVLWDVYRSDGALHRTYWVAQWPRLEVGPAFLAPLFLSPTAVRSFSVVIEPVPPARARTAIEAAVTSDEADEQLRRERGFRTTARRQKQQAATRRREAELAEGHEELRFAAFVTASGRDEDELDRACREVEQAAQHAYLDLQPMWGQQDLGFVCGALPFCHGLARAGLLDR